jgi:hypothetical protein
VAMDVCPDDVKRTTLADCVVFFWQLASLCISP